jgi:hypothetical protein
MRQLQSDIEEITLQLTLQETEGGHQFMFVTMPHGPSQEETRKIVLPSENWLPCAGQNKNVL